MIVTTQVSGGIQNSEFRSQNEETDDDISRLAGKVLEYGDVFGLK